MAFSPDGSTLATVGGSTIRLWDTASHTLLATLARPSSGVDTVAFSPDGRTLATGGDDDAVHLWNLDPDQVIADLCHRLGPTTPAQWSQLFPDQSYAPSSTLLGVGVSL